MWFMSPGRQRQFAKNHLISNGERIDDDLDVALEAPLPPSDFDPPPPNVQYGIGFRPSLAG
jgi:hypothetical protein